LALAGRSISGGVNEKSNARCRRIFGATQVVRSIPMMDVVMMALAAGFFAVSIAYVYACEQL
jgi:hypothetical protein